MNSISDNSLGIKHSKKFFRDINRGNIDYEKLNKELHKVDWDALHQSCSVEEFPRVLNTTVLEVTKKCIPEDTKRNDKKPKLSSSQRKRRSLLKKKKRVQKTYNKRLLTNPKSQILLQLKKQMESIDEQIKNTIRSELDKEERQAINSLKKDPKSFFSYSRSKLKSNHNPNILMNEKHSLIVDPKEIADNFQSFFTSVFSDPNFRGKKDPSFNVLPLKHNFRNLNLTRENFEKAIDQIKENSSAPDKEIPAKILKKCKSSLSYPIYLLWKRSYEHGYIPACLKEQLIIPIHKKGSHVYAENYRPISLTSHLSKIFERLIRDQLVQHFEENNLLNPNQHGFRHGYSCLSTFSTL